MVSTKTKAGVVMGVLENLKRLLASDDVGIGSDALASQRLSAHLSAAKQELLAYAAHAKRLKIDAEKLRQEADQWRRRAESAVASGRDDLAREALKRSFALERDADDFERQAKEDEAAIKQLGDTVRSIGQRARRAPGGPVSLDAFAEFDRMTSRFETDLAVSDLDAQMGDGAQDLSDAVLAGRIEELETARQASEELDRIKRQAPRPKPTERVEASGAVREKAARPTKGSAPPAEPVEIDNELGDELDAIRRQLDGTSSGRHPPAPSTKGSDRNGV